VGPAQRQLELPCEPRRQRHVNEQPIQAEERDLIEELSEEFGALPPALTDAVTAADMTVSPTGEPTEPEERVAEILRRYSPEDPVYRAVRCSGAVLIACAREVAAVTA
jgi:hypothetical protein